MFTPRWVWGDYWLQNASFSSCCLWCYSCFSTSLKRFWQATHSKDPLEGIDVRQQKQMMNWTFGWSPGGQRRWSCSDHHNRYDRLPLRTSRLKVKELDRWTEEKKIINSMTLLALQQRAKVKDNLGDNHYKLNTHILAFCVSLCINVSRKWAFLRDFS